MMMKTIYANQCVYTYFLLIIFHATRASTHWVVTEDGKKIHTQQEDSVFQLRRPYDLMSLLKQEHRTEQFTKIKSQLIQQKEEIENESFDNHEDVEQLIYVTNADCIKARRPLVELDLSVGTLVFTFPRGHDRRVFPEFFPVDNLYTHYQSQPSYGDNLFYDSGLKNWVTITSSNTSARTPNMETNFDMDEPYSESVRYAPNCSDYHLMDFRMSPYEHLPAIDERRQLRIDPEAEIIRYLGKWPSYQEFGRDIAQGLRENSSSWILYTLASFYWRGLGQAEPAIECVRRALNTSPLEHRVIPMFSLATLLHRAHRYEDALLVLVGIIDTAPQIPHAHYMLANIYAVLMYYNKSVTSYQSLLSLCPNFNEAIVRKHAVLCHSSIETALRAQHDNLQKTLDELKDYQRQQELWIDYHKKIRAEQAAPSALIEQRLFYREAKMRQKQDELLNAAAGFEVVKPSPGDPPPMPPTVIATEPPEDLTSSIKMKLSSISDVDGHNLLELLNLTDSTESTPATEEDARNESKGGEDERSSRIRKLLESTPSASAAASQLKATENASEGDELGEDGDRDEDNSVVDQSSVNECNSRPLLIPVTFALPPS